MTTLQLFARLAKVDVENRKVYGVIADETPDAAGEVFDYEKSKPNFIEWSGTLAKATDGASVGNVRAMHGKVVAGKLSEMVCDDVAKSISVCADIVDDNEWNKVVAGCYTGFSIGGGYGEKTKLASGLTKYEAKPTEVSIVDLPCNPNATFTLITKSTGAEELRKFAPREPVTSVAQALAKAIGVDALPEGMSNETAATAIVLAKRLEAADADPALSMAVDIAAKMLEPLAKSTKIESEVLAKGLYAVSRLACVMGDLQYCLDDSIWEAGYENDGSAVPDQLKSALKQVGKALIDMCKEEVSEIMELYNNEVAKALETQELAKSTETTDLAKAIDDAGPDGLRELIKTLQAQNAELVAQVETLTKAAAPAECGHTDITKTGGDLAKVNGALDEATGALRKTRADNTLMKARIAVLETENAVLKAQPAAQNTPRLVAVTRDGNAIAVESGGMAKGVEVAPVEGSEVATLIKQALSGPGKPLLK